MGWVRCYKRVSKELRRKGRKENKQKNFFKIIITPNENEKGKQCLLSHPQIVGQPESSRAQLICLARQRLAKLPGNS